MDHKTFLSELNKAQRLELTAKSNQAGLRHLAVFWGVTLVVGSWVFFQLPFWGLMMLPLGILLIFNFSLLHETIHATPFQSASLNTSVGRIASIIVLLPYDWFRYFHLAHHKHTNDPDNDPELGTAKPKTWTQYAVYLSGLPIWRANLKLLMRNALGNNSHNYVPKRAKPRISKEARVMLGIYILALIALASGQIWIMTCWIIPIILGQPFLRLYLLAEHGLCPPVTNMFENTRTTHTGVLIRFLAWNMSYHAEHHAYPAVPFHKLPKLHEHVQIHLKSVSNGYSEFHREYQRKLSPETL